MAKNSEEERSENSRELQSNENIGISERNQKKPMVFDKHYGIFVVGLSILTAGILIWQGCVTSKVGKQTIQQQMKAAERDAYIQFKAQYAYIKKDLPNMYQHLFVDSRVNSLHVSKITDAYKDFIDLICEGHENIKKNEEGILEIGNTERSKWEGKIKEYWDLVFDKWYFSTQFQASSEASNDKNEEDNLWHRIFGPTAASFLDYYKADQNYGYYYVFCDLLKDPRWPLGEETIKNKFLLAIQDQIDRFTPKANDNNSYCILHRYNGRGDDTFNLSQEIERSRMQYFIQAMILIKARYGTEQAPVDRPNQ